MRKRKGEREGTSFIFVRERGGGGKSAGKPRIQVIPVQICIGTLQHNFQQIKKSGKYPLSLNNIKKFSYIDSFLFEIKSLWRRKKSWIFRLSPKTDGNCGKSVGKKSIFVITRCIISFKQCTYAATHLHVCFPQQKFKFFSALQTNMSEVETCFKVIKVVAYPRPYTIDKNVLSLSAIWKGALTAHFRFL